MKKLRSKAGETLLETLFALLIIVLSMSFLATAIAVAAKLNHQLLQTNQDFSYTTDKPHNDQTVVVNGQNVTVTIYESNGYYYYDYETP